MLAHYWLRHAAQNAGVPVIHYPDLELVQRVGIGGFGEVYLAKWRGTMVAGMGDVRCVRARIIVMLDVCMVQLTVKRLHGIFRNVEDGLQDFAAEVCERVRNVDAPSPRSPQLRVMVRLRHPNVVLLLGACLYPRCIIVTEYV